MPVVPSAQPRLPTALISTLPSSTRSVRVQTRCPAWFSSVMSPTRFVSSVDDMADTCGTLAKAAETLLGHNARSVIAIVTHGILLAGATEIINKSKLQSVVCTNTVPLEGKDLQCSRLATIDISGVLAESIRRLHNGESVSYLFLQCPHVNWPCFRRTSSCDCPDGRVSTCNILFFFLFSFRYSFFSLFFFPLRKPTYI